MSSSGWTGRQGHRRFRRALDRAYASAPTSVLPNALWKTRREIPRCTPHLDGRPSDPRELALWDEDRLLFAWSARGRLSDRIRDRLVQVDLALLHQRDLGQVDLSRFPSQTGYFRLSLGPDAVHSSMTRTGEVEVDPVRLPEEANEVSAFIAACYPSLHPTAATVRSWIDHPTFDPELWIWLRRRPEDPPAALGIAERDRRIGDVSLEWIQVHPAQRRKGLGEATIRELLARCGSRVRRVTVSGLLSTPAEHLYRRCGFQGDDVWWCLRDDGRAAPVSCEASADRLGASGLVPAGHSC